jgi:NAD(P)-dependent dehydrogenase (short-subunit alcohol dehydrogenase family)
MARLWIKKKQRVNGRKEAAMQTGFDLTGQRILITGAAGGIGALTARVCASLGAAVLLVDQRPTDALAQQLREAGAHAATYVCDVTKRDDVETIAASAGAVDALVLGAGICPWDDWQDPGWDEMFERVMAVNLHGPIHFARAYLPVMIRRGHGRMVLIGSVAGRMGGLVASAHYVASKGGLHAVVKWLAKRGAPHGVLVNGIAPGAIETEMTRDQPLDPRQLPLGRKGQADEVAWPIAFLCSPAASYITGAVLDVNGGVYMS